MRKRIFFAAFLSMIVAEMGAVAATARDSARVVNNKSDSSTTQQSGNTVARSATRAVSSRATTTAPAATQQNVVNTPATVSAPATNTPGVVARAGSVQKALNTGTKVATATENTSVPKECQDAFFGCMDAFCILDNASGGRCQCSDRITELDQVLEDILKLDEQTYIMATEGVERIQMGEAEEQIIARAKAAGDKVVAGDDAKKSRTLDLSAWNNSVFSVDDDIFDSLGSSDSVSSFADKKGDSLYVASAKMCAEQVSPSCKTYTSMLQLVYSQRIKSDCVAYENSLRAQKTQSQQKLQTAQKALRDAALTEYQNQNKYATVGECAIAFSQCMQTTAECGADYTGCVTLAAKENVKNNKSGTKAKQTKIKGAVSGADITLAASTLDQLLAKKTICESVTKQCVNVNKNDAVWTAFLRNAAPALKSAELIAEQNLRSSCIPTIAECFKNSCKAQFGEDDANYDMCLSNPEVYKSLCKVQLEPCLEATGGTYDNPTDSSLWVGLKSMLAAMKVDACTAEVKSCLTERCGDDYSGCIGLDMESIGRLCPYQKLTACMSEKKDQDTVEEYVAQIAQGLVLQIDNALVAACQNAVNEAMIRVCGDTESCEAAQFDLSSLTSFIKPMACKYNNPTGTGSNGMKCYPNATQFSDNEIYTLEYKIKWKDNDEESNIVESITKTPVLGRSIVGGNSSVGYGVYATLAGRPYMSAITYGEDGNFDYDVDWGQVNASISKDSTEQVKTILNSALNRIMNSIKSDPKVEYCMTGRSVPGFTGMANIGNTENVRFANLTDGVRSVIADDLMSLLYDKNKELEDSFSDELKVLDEEITKRIAEVAEDKGTSKEVQVDARNMERCTCDRTPHRASEEGDETKTNCLTVTDKYRYVRRVTASGENKYMTDAGNLGSRKEVTDVIGKYDASTNVCTLRTITYHCKRWTGTRCREYDDGSVVSTTTVQLPTSN